MSMGTQTLRITECTTILDTATSSGLLLFSTNSTDEIFQDCCGIKFDTCQSGPYATDLYGAGNESEPVYCGCIADRIWTVIQKRFDGSIVFDRNWADYQNGFDDASREYWLGNDAIYQLTSHSNYTLNIVLTDWHNVTEYAIYTTFRIADEGGGTACYLEHTQTLVAIVIHCPDIMATCSNKNQK